MTGNENDKPVNWVERKANCTLSSVFESIFYQVELDVQEANKLKYNNWTFECVKDTESFNHTITVTRETPGFADDRPTVVFNQEQDSIYVYCPKGKRFQITMQWNHDTMICDICLDGESRKLWQISCAALWDLFFIV